jgi:hypothetical protein
MALRPVPKPDGFDMRAARASRGTAADWLPDDALFHASEAMKDDPPVVAMLITWYSRDPSSGRLVLKFRHYQEHERQSAGLAADMAAWLTAP